MRQIPALLLAVVASACGPGGEESSAPAQEVEIYEGRGQYLFHGTEDSLTTVTINHEEIPGFMDAMAMPYPIEDLDLVEGLEPGQDISFRVVLEPDGYFYIDRIELLEPEGI